MKLRFNHYSIIVIISSLVVFNFVVSKAEVITLTEDTFTDKVKEQDTVWFVKFCVPWCKHCKNLGSLWEDLGKAMEGENEIEIGEVNCGLSKPVCSKVDIHSYPTFKAFYNGEEIAKYSDEWKSVQLLQPQEKTVEFDMHFQPKNPLKFELAKKSKKLATKSKSDSVVDTFYKFSITDGCYTPLGPRNVELLKTFVLEEAQKAETNAQLESEKEL